MSYMVTDVGLITDGNQAAGYILNFTERGSYMPAGHLGQFTQDQVNLHNHRLADLEWDAMLRSGVGLLYLNRASTKSGWEVCDWPNVHRVNITYYKTSWHNIGRTRADVWFPLDGSVWHGVNIGDQQVCHVRRNKQDTKRKRQ